MSATYAVNWSETAERDLKRIIDYIAKDSPVRAYEAFKGIKRKASILQTFPDRGRVVPELQDQGITQYREMIVAPWRVIYRTAEKTVYVLSVLDSRQNIEDILLQRLLNLKL